MNLSVSLPFGKRGQVLRTKPSALSGPLDTSGGLQAGTSVKRIEEATPSSHQCIGGEHMQIILLEDVRSLGKAGDVVKVSDGYGRNFLIPQKKAILATEKGVKMLEHQKRQVQARMGKMKKNLEKVAEEINALSCTFTKAVGESGKLFGSVTSMEIEAYLKENGIDVDRKKIVLDEPIKSIGMFTVPIKLHPEIVAQLKVWVVQE
jgi:large subunit ribosomal protein L9